MSDGVLVRRRAVVRPTPGASSRGGRALAAPVLARALAAVAPRLVAPVLVALGGLVGCTGTLLIDGPDDGDSGIQVWLDSEVPLDARVPGVDSGPPGADGGPPDDSGLADSGPVDAGPVDAGPVDPCAGVSCPANANCQPSTGACRCDEGFLDMAGACVAIPPGDPAGRTQAAVCAAWNDGRVENASPAWTAGASTCDAGTMAEAAIDDTLRRVNLYRWLAGQDAVSYDASDHQGMMECAHMMSEEGRLSHEPGTGWACYTSAGAAAAGRSNIALGYRTPATAIDGYMEDGGTPSLGHRRWILARRLSSVEIGFAGRGQCLGVFNSGGSSDRAWTAYPNQGFAPIQTARNTWSFQAESVSISGATDATITRVSDGADLPVDTYQTGLTGPPNTLGMIPSGWSPAAGETYRVTITGTSAGDITYETTLVSC